MCYPDNCLRGISNQSQVQEDDLVANDVFYFLDDHTRADGTFEQSINWDDENAIPFTLSQKRQDGSLQFRGGVAVIARCDLDRLSKLPAFGEALSYDRQPLPENPYHGNLILTAGISKARRKAIAVTLAMHVSRIIFQAYQKL